MKQLEKELEEVKQKLAKKENSILLLQESHAAEVNRLEVERDQIIQSLMESEERYRLHISATTAVTWHGNALGNFHVPQVSWRNFTGQEWSHHRDRGWMQMIHDRQQLAFATKWQKQIQIGEKFMVECQIWSAEHQEYRHCEMNVMPIFMTAEDDKSFNSEIHTWIGSVVDVHERKLAEERILSTNELLTKTVAELQRSNMELERFVYIASHDLKEPLRGIQNLSTMLLALYQEKIDEEGKELLGLISESGHRMQQLISALHKYSRVTLNYDSFQHVNTDRLLDEIIRGLERLPGQQKFIVQRPAPLPELVYNPAHLQTIFQNLLSNALKYSHADLAVIEIGLVATDKTASGAPVFYIKDNGIGIKPEHHESVFDMFRRLHSGTEYSDGTGAGLALVKKIIVQYDGKIWLESEFGSGSTFYFTLGDESVGDESVGDKNVGDKNVGDKNVGDKNVGDESLLNESFYQ